jgi:hypothetical protein
MKQSAIEAESTAGKQTWTWRDLSRSRSFTCTRTRELPDFSRQDGHHAHGFKDPAALQRSEQGRLTAFMAKSASICTLSQQSTPEQITQDLLKLTLSDVG